jgi:hypothetical protein
VSAYLGHVRAQLGPAVGRWSLVAGAVALAFHGPEVAHGVAIVLALL